MRMQREYSRAEISELGLTIEWGTQYGDIVNDVRSGWITVDDAGLRVWIDDDCYSSPQMDPAIACTLRDHLNALFPFSPIWEGTPVAASVAVGGRTLADALLAELARIRDVAIPAYQAIGVSGALCVAAMRVASDRAMRALAEQDGVACLELYATLRGFQL